MQTDSPIVILDEAKAWDLLAGQQLGRLAVQSDLGIDVFPVNFTVDGESIIFRTADGAKLTDLHSHPKVSFEVDAWSEHSGFSVVAKGNAEPVTNLVDIARIEALRLKPWVPTVKTTFVRIFVTEISARKFIFGPDPIAKYR